MQLDDYDQVWDTHHIHEDEDGTYWFSPDGEGRIWYDTLEDAEADCGLPFYGSE